MWIYGVNPVVEALRAGRVTTLLVGGRTDARLSALIAKAEGAGIDVRRVSSSELDRLAHGGVHQGVVAELRRVAGASLDDLIADRSRPPLIVVLDSVEDPQNVGAIVRTVDAAGASGVVRQSRRAAALEGAAAKAAAGALSHVKIVDVVNIARSLEELKEAGVWTVGLAGDATLRYHQIDLTVPIAVVVGAEGTGLRRLVRERCDWLASIPMLGHVDSLNVSVAAGIVLFEALRQRGSGRLSDAGDNEASRERPPRESGG